MMPLEQASKAIQLWTTIQVIDGYINTKQTHRLRSIYDVLKDQIDEHTQGMGEFTVEDFVNYSNKDLERAGFRRHGEPNDNGDVLYLIPLVLYLIMPQELMVFDIDDTKFAYPKSMKRLLKSMVGKNVEPLVAHGILVQSDIEDVASGPDHEAIRALFKQVNRPYEPGDDTNLSVTYDKGLVTISVTTDNYGGHRYNATCEIDARGHKFDLGSFIYIMDSVKGFLDSTDNVPINYDDFDTWKANYLEAVQHYLVR